MSASDHLDAAIDHVAARMVSVPDDADLALRIVSALPERTSRLRWLIPQLAAIGAIVIAAILWTTRNNTAPTTAALPSSEVAPLVELAGSVIAREPGTAWRTLPLESASARIDSRELRRDLAVAASGRVGGRLELVELVEPLDGDFDRSLPPIAAVTALVISDMDPGALPGSPALVLAPIAITELPLTAESFSPR
jgi:hypothetical protein